MLLLWKSARGTAASWKTGHSLHITAAAAVCHRRAMAHVHREAFRARLYARQTDLLDHYSARVAARLADQATLTEEGLLVWEGHAKDLGAGLGMDKEVVATCIKVHLQDVRVGLVKVVTKGEGRRPWRVQLLLRPESRVQIETAAAAERRVHCRHSAGEGVSSFWRLARHPRPAHD